MCSSAVEQNRKDLAKTGFVYLFLSLLCMLFGAVYEQFSHGVYSGFMIYAFVFPLACGALPFLLMAFYAKRPAPGILSRGLCHCGVATLTIGSLFQGALEIYGTTNRLVRVYWFLGGAFLLLALFACLRGGRRRPPTFAPPGRGAERSGAQAD